MSKPKTPWLSRRRVVAMAVLGLVIAGMVAVKTQAATRKIVLVPRQTVAAVAPSAASRPANPSPTLPNPGQVVTDGSKSQIEIDLSYAGERLELFGTLGDTGADAVVVRITSPPETAKLNQKGRVGPFWMSVKQHSVENIPFMYHVNASDKIESMLSAELRGELGIGFEAVRKQMVIHTTKGTSAPEDAKTVFEGMLELKKGLKLYQINDDKRVVIRDGKLFRHYVDFPAAAKQGDYVVDTFAFRKGRLVGKAVDRISVQKVGLEANIVEWAQDYPKIYGLCAVVLALGAGLLVGFVFGKGGHH